MSNQKKTIGVLVVLVVSSMLLIVPIQETNAQFILAVWPYPDGDGQGVQYVKVYNGSQLLITWDSSDITIMEIGSDTNLTLAVYCWLDNALVWADGFEDAKNYFQHSVIVSTPANSSVFSQQNFTYIDGNDTSAPMFWYRYDIILDIPFVDGETYEVFLTYEIYY